MTEFIQRLKQIVTDDFTWQDIRLAKQNNYYRGLFMGSAIDERYRKILAVSSFVMFCISRLVLYFRVYRYYRKKY